MTSADFIEHLFFEWDRCFSAIFLEFCLTKSIATKFISWKYKWKILSLPLGLVKSYLHTTVASLSHTFYTSLLVSNKIRLIHYSIQFGSYDFIWAVQIAAAEVRKKFFNGFYRLKGACVKHLRGFNDIFLLTSR